MDVSGFETGGLDLSGIDTGRANVARVYDFLAGGKDNFPADRQEAARLLEVVPQLPGLIRDNRLFLHRIVAWLARQRGMRQFLDLGAGLPSVVNTHEVAQGVDKRARVVYADNDPVAVLHAGAMLSGPDVAAVRADLRDPPSVLTHPSVAGVLDLREPVVVMLAMVLHFVSHADADAIVAAYAQAVAPGSYIVVSVGSGDEEHGGALTRRYTAAPLYNHAPDQILRWFEPVDLLDPPGLTDARDWRPGQIVAPPSREGGHVLAAVAQVRDPPARSRLPLRRRTGR
jgi:hypothetical protein